MTLQAKPFRHLPGSEEGSLQDLSIYDPNEFVIAWGFSDRPVGE